MDWGEEERENINTNFHYIYRFSRGNNVGTPGEED